MTRVSQYIFDGAKWQNEQGTVNRGAVTASPPANLQPLWFNIPADICRRSRKVFAHYFGPYPRSIDNGSSHDTDFYATAFLNPNGENGKHAAYGGFLRDRPLFRSHVTATNWKYLDCLWDIQTAQAAGIDGFFVDLLGITGSNWDRYITLRDAAHDLNSGFVVIPMVDTNGATGAASPAVAARQVAQFANKNCSWRLADERFVFSSFKTEGKPLQWWKDVISVLKTTYGLTSAFLSVALDARTHAAYSSVNYGESVWSYGADPAAIRAAGDQAPAARSRGKVYMAPTNGQDCRPYAGLYDEAGNTEATRAAWEKLITQGADLVQIVTWSDFSEGATSVPSDARGNAPLNLASYYIVRYKTGTFPAIVRDAVILSHRSNSVHNRPSGPQTEFMKQVPRGHLTVARDTVEVLSFLTAPADVSISVGIQKTVYAAPAGLFAKLVPLGVGSVSATVARAGVTVLTVASTVTVVAVPVRDDKQYFWAASTASAPPPTGAENVTGVTVRRR